MNKLDLVVARDRGGTRISRGRRRRERSPWTETESSWVKVIPFPSKMNISSSPTRRGRLGFASWKLGTGLPALYH